MALSIVILAAGQGKRMRSHLPKVLHRLAGKPLLEHVVQAAQQLDPDQPPIIIYGHQGDIVRHAFANLSATWVEQNQQLGTGHALLQALPFIQNDHRVLVLYGDVPLITTDTLKNLIKATPANAVGMITANFSDPTGLGRIIRDHNHQVIEVIEQKDLQPAQLPIQEINSGIYLFPENFLAKMLPNISNQNAQKEHYLTDVIKMAVADHLSIHTQLAPPEEVLGVNDKSQLAYLERIFQRKNAEKLMQEGVTLLDPHRLDVRGELTVGDDVTMDVNVIIEGRVIIGNRCVIGPNTLLRNVILGEGVEVKANSVLDGAEIGSHCTIGPFARIRPGTILAAHAHVGNFVEIKNSVIGESTKVNHLSYIGDAEIGLRVNVGAGTITCNYDGINKNRTLIGDDAFIGSNTSLVAPIEIGERATVGAGSTITRNAPPYQLTVCRSQQRSIENWQRPKKKET